MSTVLAPQKPELIDEPVDDVPLDRLWRLSVEQYHEMVRQGILKSGEPVELLDGLLVKKMGKNPPHVIALNLLRDFLVRLGLQSWSVWIQDPMTLDTSEPEPDLMLVRGDPRDYADRHPAPDDVGLVVEVAEATLRFDRNFKKRLYARNRIRQYWVVNLIDEQIEVYTQPSGLAASPGYDEQRVYRRSEAVPLHLDGIEVAIPVNDILP